MGGEGGLLFTAPFHVVVIGNGAAIAESFLQKYGVGIRYSGALKSFISVNGFLAPDVQLSAILHAAGQIFETTPANRPDLPVSWFSRFVFSPEYLERVHPNLALISTLQYPIQSRKQGECALCEERLRTRICAGSSQGWEYR